MLWQVSRFVYMHFERDHFVVRNPLADCLLYITDEGARALVHRFANPAALKPSAPGDWASMYAAQVCKMLARAQIIVPCTEDGKPLELCDPKFRQWDFHDLIFHSQSRLGRTEKHIGGTFAFRREIAPQPGVKPNKWLETFYALPQPDLATLARLDVPLTTAIETRRSIRHHSIVPPSLSQLSEFLFRTVRTRSVLETPDGEILSRPYPNGGAMYEQEFYITVDSCLDCPRGFYYYDSFRHGLCLISGPSSDMEALLQEASAAVARLGRPQILITIASRFHRMSWKYRGMAYATQLKNIGAIYQTMYLVATSMNLAASALGVGNTDRLCRMAGLDYLEEGSIGEFMLGRPL
jgi:oxazoline/thiazoline dehydrogenase